VLDATTRDLLVSAYAAFNARDIDRALATMHADVEWPNGMEGGYVHGHDAVRDYWTRQWKLIDPDVEPRALPPNPAGASPSTFTRWFVIARATSSPLRWSSTCTSSPVD
jgi:hypothetical protein